MSERWKDRLSIGNVVASTQTKEGLNLMLISGDVSYFCADVIVNAVPTDLQLGGGSLSRALLQKAGPMLQKELNATREETEEEVGSIFMTSGCNLDCKAVLHVVAPDWDSGAGSPRQIMTNIIEKCLTTVEQLSFSSITFPMIGTGNLGFPKATFAELILSEVLKFSSSARLKTLREVHFLVHVDDDESCQAFLDKLTRLSSGNPSKDRILMTGDTQGLFGTVTSPTSTRYEMKIGVITFQVAVGDITKESTDVIVNSTTRMFNLKLGVSKAILEGAGPAVEHECAVLATQPHRDFIVTQGGYLMCKRIIHVLGENDVRKTVSSVLEECERRKYKSVSLPAIGTGNAGKNPKRVADDMIDAVVDFTRKYSTSSLKKVKVVVFQTKLLNVFYGEMKKREITTSPIFQSTFSKAAFLGLHKQHPIIQWKSTRTVEQNLSTDCSSEGQNCAWEAGITNEQEEESDDDIPESWTDMNQQLFCVIQLQPGQSEYDTVKERFSRTCRFYTIEKIQRIQNTFLWQSYQMKKKHMDMKNGHMGNERILFHGTSADSVPHINQHGFNRSYAGKNAIAYGKGTYFAVDASYSANDNYSTPDGNGRKHVYIARVLTGAYTLGHEELISPPSKNTFNSTDLFDSVTDDIQHPKVFVVFFDYQAYPEYLITFR
ncbi:protein mono-ADP-ribosyltransferase PARP15 isoform X2 [Artibeus jamaicensis]|uniref:protein mono-ADP-ribosyltransferase PARP15 isoform X2 n=1 Tax=Artibeus jamaicensis TaxID=9417 RepID=UPI00235AB016|nr:protein mono-ADP-ribosyltransferase PARP15 isoform X2 [Artibeus jamaicensis]